MRTFSVGAVLLALTACAGAKDDTASPDTEPPDSATPAQNHAPTTPSIHLGPDQPTTVDELVVTLTAESFDEDGDALTYTYQWFRDGVEIEGATDATLSSDETTRGQSIDVYVTATDGQAQSPAATSSLQIGNAAPELVLTFEPEAPLGGEGFEVLVDASDPDGDEVSLAYAWTVDGVDVEGSDASIAGDLTTRDQAWVATVTGSDGELETIAAAEVVIANGAPTGVEVLLEPDPAYEASTLVPTPTGIDPDGDALSWSYSWVVDGLGVSTDDTLTGDFFDKHQLVELTATPHDGTDEGAAISAVLTISNTAPSATGATLVPDTFDTETEVDCTLEGWADDDGDSEGFTTLWSVDGVEVSTDATLDPELFERDQQVVCTLTPNDGEDDGEPVSSAASIVSNSAPSIASVNISPDPATVDDELSCSWDGFSDADGDADASTVAWTVDGAAAGSDLTLSGAAKGQVVVCTVTPSDGADAGTAVSASLTISNAAPSAVSAEISPDPLSADAEATCTAVGFSDPDGDADASMVAWFVDGVSLGSSNPVSGGFSAGDELSCELTPHDGEDAGAPVTASLTVNSAPELAEVELSPEEATSQDVFTCTPGTTSDVDGDLVTTSTRWTVDGSTLPLTGDTLSAQARDAVVQCHVTPSDGLDDGDEVSSDEVTVANSPPSVTLVRITPSTAYAGDTLTCSWGFSDVDGDSDLSTVAWTLNGAAVGTGSTYSGPFVDDDVVVCTVTPDDGTDTGTPASAQLEVSNTPPVIEELVITDPATVADTIVCTPTISDVDGTTEFVEQWSWVVNGSDVGVETDSLTGEHFTSFDDVTCTLVATDGSDSSLPASASMTTSNSPPTFDEVTVTPERPVVGETITCAAETTDLDGDGVAVSYAWTIDGATVGTGETLTSFSAGDTVTCTASVTDGYDTTGAEGVSVEVNRPPSVSGVAITPTSPQVEDTLTCSWSFSDADGDADASSVAWTIDGSTVGTGSTLSGVFERDDLVTCTVTPDDGLEETAAQAASATVVNAPPELIGLSLDELFTDTVAEVSWSQDDADGDAPAVSYRWTVDGTEVATTSTLDGATWFDKGQLVTVTVTLDDGYDPVSDTASVVVSNTPPTAPIVLPRPYRPQQDVEDMFCEVVEEGTDADGDAITYTFSWSVDGTTWGGSTDTNDHADDTIPAGEAFVGELWLCTATPSDDEHDGEAASTYFAPRGDVGVTAHKYDSACVWDYEGDLDCWGEQEGTISGPLVDAAAFCGLDSSGDVECLYGDSKSGATAISFGAGLCRLNTDGSVSCDSGWFDDDGPYTTIDAGESHACGLYEDGTANCWGDEYDGQSDKGELAVPDTDDRYVTIMAGAYVSCALKTDLELVCWGVDDEDFSQDHGQYTEAPTGEHYVDLHAVTYTVCGITDGFEPDCWGRNNDTQAQPTGGSGAYSIAAGNSHGCAVADDDATVYCWGADDDGVLSEAP